MNEGRWGVRVSVEPPAEPVTRAEAKAHLRVDATDEDALIDGLIVAAREVIEAAVGRALVRQTQVLTLDSFPCGDGTILIPNPPLSSVTSVQYVDSNGATQTVTASDYSVDTASEPGRIRPAYGKVWPVPRIQLAAVAVTYVCGYAPDDTGSPTDYGANVPQAIKQAMLLLIGTMYENRESVADKQLFSLPEVCERLIWRHKVLGV